MLADQLLHAFEHNEFLWTRVLPGIVILCAVLFVVFLILRGAQKPTVKLRKTYGEAALFVGLLGLYSAFYIVKLIFAQQLLLRLW